MNYSAVVDVGTPSAEFKTGGSAEIRFHGFVDLSTVKNEFVKSSEFTCSGHPWTLAIYPGGRATSAEGKVGVYLHNMSEEEIDMNFSFVIKDCNGKEVQKSSCATHTVPSKMRLGWPNCFGRAAVMDSLVEGALVIGVYVELVNEPSDVTTGVFIPKNPLVDFIRSMCMDEQSADVAFEVGKQEESCGAAEATKTAPVIFYAHRLILHKCAPQLSELSGSGGKETPVPITDVEPDVFRHLLDYVYGGELTNGDMEDNAKALIDAADKYAISNLKLEAEACFVRSTTISVENMMDCLLYADGMNCALLKEAVMDFIVENKVDIISKISFEDVPGTMVRDVLSAVARGEKKVGSDEGSKENQFGTMRISRLRKKCQEKGLDIDGSREMLIAALKENA